MHRVCKSGSSPSRVGWGQDLADEFQQTIADVKKKMDQQVHWNWTPRVSNGSTTMARLASEVGLLWKTRRALDIG